jgi:hypothetical protein
LAPVSALAFNFKDQSGSSTRSRHPMIMLMLLGR